MTKIDLASLRVYAVLDGERLAALWAEIDRLLGVLEAAGEAHNPAGAASGKSGGEQRHPAINSGWPE